MDRDLVALALYSFFASNRSGLFLVYLPIFLVTARGASVPAALALVSAAYVASSLFGPVAGRWSDRIGRRKPFLLAAEAGSLPLFVAVPFLPTYWECGLAFVAAMTILALGAPALTAYVSDLTASSERGGGYGLLNAAGFVGQVLGFVAIALLVGPFGIDVLFPFVVVVMITSLAVVAFTVPDRRTVVAPKSVGWTEARPVLTFSVAVSIRALGFGAVGTFFGLYATTLGASEAEVAVIAIVGLSVAAATSVPFGRLVDRIGELRGIWYGTIVSLAAIVLFLVAPVWWFLVPAQSLRLAGVSLFSPAMLAWVSKLAPPGHRAEYLGLFALVNSTLWSLGPLAGSAALEFAGVPGLFAFALGTTAISLVALEVLFLARGRRGPGPPEVPTSERVRPGPLAQAE